ncbi:hypothetical protein BDZ91DRAFT_413623 [Kalaharituber pfeilii]|nr:hypothetical protein BDZ91DRAFT_413623 [Kalaharituber pfeilii]
MVSNQASEVPASEPQQQTQLRSGTKDEASKLTVLSVLGKALFVRASELLARTTLAAKGKDGKVFWLTLEPVFHSQLLQTVIAVAKHHGLDTTPVEVLKSTLFDFLLDILNGCPQQDFFSKKEVESKGNRANRERKRLARKRSRAAKRERLREREKFANTCRRSTQSRSCDECGKKFESRKRLSKHKCPGEPDEKPPVKKVPDVKASEAKRARRAKARKAKAERRKVANAKMEESENKVTETSARPEDKVAEESVADKKLTNDTPVTGSSGETATPVVAKPEVECEDCDSPATHMCGNFAPFPWPKCEYHYKRALGRGYDGEEL